MCNQGNDPFWSKKLPQEKPEKPDKPERATRQKTKAVKKTAHRKRTTASSNPAPDDDVDNPDLEVGLDSLGLFFMRLIDDDIFQDDAEVSHADAAEVIILSSDSEPLPSVKIRQANQKVKIFSSSCLFGSQISYEDPTTRSSSHNPAQRPGSYLRRFTEQSGSETPFRGL